MNIDQSIKEQTQFLWNVGLTLAMLKAYKNNPSDFLMLFSKKVIDKYQMEQTNPEYLWESLDEFANDMAFGNAKFAIKNAGGIFMYIDFAIPKKKKLDMLEAVEFFEQCGIGWSI
jgi:hypothetical protein